MTEPAFSPVALAPVRGPASLASPASLEDVHRSVRIPTGSWWKRMLAFAGPAYMVSVGYMDPGNWATDIEGGARFGYRLVWVLLMSNLMAVLLQTLSARLGLVTGRDLAQACRDAYGPAVRWALFLLCEIAIAACDLAEVLGTAFGLHLLTAHLFGHGIPLFWAVLLTGFDVLILLGMQRAGIRRMEAFILALIFTIGACYVVQLFLCKPEWGAAARGLIPSPLSSAGGEHSQLYIAIGIIGATVMPHNLYLHSSLVQSRDVPRTPRGIAQACRFNLIDAVIALNLAFFVNAAILIVAAATFGRHGLVPEKLSDAHQMLQNVLGTKVAPIAFALALLCAGQSSTLTGTLAGQITMEGFLHFRMRPWLRRLITRALAIVPAMLVIGLTGDDEAEGLLVFSQVVLSLQLSFAVVPLVKFTSSRRRMGEFVNARWLKALAWGVTLAIAGLNGKLVWDILHQWSAAAGGRGWLVTAVAAPLLAAMGALLLWLMFRPEPEARPPAITSAEAVVAAAAARARPVRRVGVALEATAGDAPMLAEALALARAHRAELVLMHVVEGVGGQWYGERTDDAESRHDDVYMLELAERLGRELAEAGVRVRIAMGFGAVTRELVRLAEMERLDLLVVGGHGHKGLADLLRGATIDGVRHGLNIPLLAVRGRG